MTKTYFVIKIILAQAIKNMHFGFQAQVVIG
jgi:hypothetical protein